MRARLIENTRFVRGQEPKHAMGLGDPYGYIPIFKSTLEKIGYEVTVKDNLEKEYKIIKIISPFGGVYEGYVIPRDVPNAPLGWQGWNDISTKSHELKPWKLLRKILEQDNAVASRADNELYARKIDVKELQRQIRQIKKFQENINKLEIPE